MVASPGDASTLDRDVRLAVYRKIVEEGRPPTAPEMAVRLGVATLDVEASLRRLADGHVLVLAPGTPYIWMANPFSAIPTTFEVEVGDRRYFGNCIWDALGIFADMAPLIGEVLGPVTGSISASDSGGSVTEAAEFTYEPFRGADGNPTTVKNAVLGFVPEFHIGRSSGHADVHGVAFDGNYGEGGAFDYSSEGHEHIRV